MAEIEGHGRDIRLAVPVRLGSARRRQDREMIDARHRHMRPCGVDGHRHQREQQQRDDGEPFGHSAKTPEAFAPNRTAIGRHSLRCRGLGGSVPQLRNRAPNVRACYDFGFTEVIGDQ